MFKREVLTAEVNQNGKLLNWFKLFKSAEMGISLCYFDHMPISKRCLGQVSAPLASIHLDLGCRKAFSWQFSLAQESGSTSGHLSTS